VRYDLGVRGGKELMVAGERLVALPQRALWWPDKETLFVADVHLGKAASFRSRGVPVPFGSTNETLGHLDGLLRALEPRHLVMLGDLWHAKDGRTPDVVAKFLAWRREHRHVGMTLVEGNHDRRSGRLPADSDIREVEEPHLLGPFALCHYPETEAAGAYRLAGHVHPGVVLEGRGLQALKLPCFLFGSSGAILPAFGSFTGNATIRPAASDRVFVVADECVIEVPSSA